MFRLRKPDERCLEQIRERHTALPLSYPEVGCTRAPAPAGYTDDGYRVQLGAGAVVFERAREALRDWRMLRLGWVEPCWPHAPIKEGVLVGTLARLLGVWAVNVCRIVEVVDENARFGFAYGTLPGHVERGEERFLVERRDDDSVWYEVRAVSKPGTWLTRLGYPLTRRWQRRFGRDSMQTMVEAVRQ
jgi:uncharacterized protein (UPF0548 family)